MQVICIFITTYINIKIRSLKYHFQIYVLGNKEKCCKIYYVLIFISDLYVLFTNLQPA